MIPVLDENGDQCIKENGKKATKECYYAAWTQGCLLNFTTNSFFASANGEPDLQISIAKPMVWDSKIGVMDEGEVTINTSSNVVQVNFSPLHKLNSYVCLFMD
jgi:hypothetical protein